MTHAFHNYSQFRNLPKTQVVFPKTQVEATLEVCEPDPHNTAVIASRVTWGIKITKRGLAGCLVTGYKWFREDGTPVEDGSILQGRMVDNALRLLNQQ